jgi:ATP-dependent protease ClpP protease subunit|nr:MAG TPA: Putative ATP dependent Clp protease [Caudoviricetes sp.]
MDKRKTKYRFEQMGTVHKLYVYDDVTAYGQFNWETWEYDESETSANYFRKQLEEIPETNTIELHINSNGGEVKEGLAIYNMLKQHNAQKICYVDGFAYSIASVICMACDKIVMGLGTSMLIHNMAACVCGNAAQLRKMADDLDVLMESNRKIYMARAKNLTEEQLIEMMDRETFLTPEQCLEYGFCDEIGGNPVDQKVILDQVERTIRQLRQELAGQKSFKEELMTLMQTHPNDPEPKPKLNNGNEKALKMMGAFLNSISRKVE